MSQEAPVEIMAFTAEEASLLSGLSVRQLRDWQAELYAPKWDSGFYSFTDLVALRVLSILRNQHNIPPRVLKKAGAYLKSKHDQPWSGLRLGVGPHRKIEFLDRETGKWHGADAAGQTIATIALDEVRRPLTTAVRKARKRDPKTVGRIDRQRGVCSNDARIAGTRVRVSAVRDCIEDGMSDRDILREFPTLKLADIKAVRAA